MDLLQHSLLPMDGAFARWATFGALVVVSLAHSILGEQALLRPLFADHRWSLSTVPRGPAQSIFRFAWHLTSLAWVGLGAIVVEVPAGLAVGTVCLLSAVIIAVSLRGHLAWPIFLFAAFWAFDPDSLLPTIVVTFVSGLAVCLAVAAMAVHVYWAAGGKAGLKNALPQDQHGRPLFNPGPVACSIVAVALGTFAALVVAVGLGAASDWTASALGVAVAVLVARAVGDGKRVGFSKADHDTSFGRLDDALYTPAVVTMAFGALAAFRLGAIAH